MPSRANRSASGRCAILIPTPCSAPEPRILARSSRRYSLPLFCREAAVPHDLLIRLRKCDVETGPVSQIKRPSCSRLCTTFPRGVPVRLLQGRRRIDPTSMGIPEGRPRIYDRSVNQSPTRRTTVGWTSRLWSISITRLLLWKRWRPRWRPSSRGGAILCSFGPYTLFR